MADVTYVELDAEAMRLFDKMQAEKKKARKAYAADKSAKLCKESVIAAMDGEMFAKLPDGRIIQRVPRCREMPARKKQLQQWEDLTVAIVADETDPVVAFAGD